MQGERRRNKECGCRKECFEEGAGCWMVDVGYKKDRINDRNQGDEMKRLVS